MEGAAEEGWMTMEKEDKPRGILSDAEYAEWEADMLKLIEYSESRFRSAEEQSTRALEAMLPSNAPWPRARLDEQFRAERAEAYVEKLKIDVSGYKGTIGELIDRVHAEMARAEKAERALDDVDESRARAIRAVVAAQWGVAILFEWACHAQHPYDIEVSNVGGLFFNRFRNASASLPCAVDLVDGDVT